VTDDPVGRTSIGMDGNLNGLKVVNAYGFKSGIFPILVRSLMLPYRSQLINFIKI